MHRPLRWIRRRLDDLSWVLLPGHCVMCAQPSEVPADLCAACDRALPWIVAACVRCALPCDAACCTDCRRLPPPYDRAVAPLRYVEPTIGMIHRLKFAGSRVDARVLGGLLARRVRAETGCRPNVIVPVPLGRARLLRRGHNQAALLARWVGDALDIAVDYRSCTRIRETPPQTGSSRAARLRNLAGAFAADGSLAGRHIAIVDDVLTTGSTVAEIARTLRAAGADTIDVWCAARTVPASHIDARTGGTPDRDC
jgi:ComF family protein